MNGPSQDRIYREQVEGFESDKRDRVIPAFGIRRKVIRLDQALNVQQLGIKGDFLYADYNSTGVGLLQLNNSSEDAFPILALAGIQDLPFDDVYITANAQPGLIINLWYGYRSRFVSPTSAIATIGSITNPVKNADYNGNSIDSLAKAGVYAGERLLSTIDGGNGYGVSFESSANMTAGTPLNVSAAASNTGGIMLVDVMRYALTNIGANRSTYLCKATAPASIVDGEVQAAVNSMAVDVGGTVYVSTIALMRAKRIGAGLRQDFMNLSNDTSAFQSAKYTLLP